MNYRVITDQNEWDEQVLALGGHPLQMWGWGALKAAHNWRVARVFALEGETVKGGAQLLLRRLPRPFNDLVYIPRGPFAATGEFDRVSETVVDYVKSNLKAISITAEPDQIEPMPAGWIASQNTILIANTLILNLHASEDELLAAMTKKTRQYIRKSGREAIEIKRVRSAADIQKCLDIYHQTAERAGFSLHDDQYYHDVATNLDESSVIFATYHQGQPVAFLWLALSAETAFELYGGVNDIGQQLRANYALKWHAICKSKEWGIARYDFNGLLNDGVSTFKRGFADHEDLLAGTFDYPLSPFYSLWAKGLPTAKKVVRRIKRLRG